MKSPVSLFVKYGPVGVLHALKVEWLLRKTQKLKENLAMECAMHEEIVTILNNEINQAAKAQQRATQAAARYWTAVNMGGQS
jgi:hypothetical protein